MANPAPTTRTQPWRLPLLTAVTVLIVVGPALLLNWATHASLKAADWVQHSVLVEARAQQLTYEVRNLEAATLALGMTETMGVIQPTLAKDLTKLKDAHIPVDIRFEQGLETLGLQEFASD